MIALGVVLANIIALIVLYKFKLDFDDLILLEAYCFLGAFIGAKILYLLVSWKDIEWNRIFEFDYFNALMQGGFVFYGGLIGGLIFILIAGKIHKIETEIYIRTFIFLIPFIHAFGRVGCFLAGCCYGIPYNGPGAVIFPEASYAPHDLSLFPVQLAEAIILFCISFFIMFLEFKFQWKYTIETYLFIYSKARFCLEYFRYDEERGYILFLSTSQWISACIIIFALIMVWRKKYFMKI